MRPRVFTTFAPCHAHALRAGVPNGQHARAKRVGVARHVMALVASLVATPLCAEVPGTAYIYPAGAPAGSKTSVRIGGYFLHDSAPWTITGPNIAPSARITRTDKIWFDGPLIRQPASQGKEDYPADYLGEIAIEAAAAPGVRRWSVRTDQGVTPGLPFVIGRLPEVVEQETDGEPIPVGVTLPVVVNGRTFPRQDIDVWTFDAQAGQVITCTVLAARINSPLISRLEIRGPDGAVLTEDVGSLAGDAFVQFAAPTAGRYAVHIHDAEYGGLQHYVYRLLITAGPFVAGVFPLGGQPGETLNIELRGANLPASTAQVTLPNTPGEIFWWHPEGLAAGELGIPIDISPGIAIREIEPNDESLPQSLAVSQPDAELAINGVIDRAGDVDHFSFAAKPGVPIRVSVRAAALGSPLDSVISVLGPNGQAVAQADDVNGSPDASLTFTPAVEGPHLVVIKDRIARRGGPEYVYRLHIAVGAEQPAAPFVLKILVDVLNVDRGGKATLRVDIQRFGFNEAIELSCPNLPAGVTLSGGSVPAGGAQANLTIEAQPMAKPGLQSVQIVGTAKRDGQELRAVATLPVQPSEPLRDSVLLSINVPTPFKIYGRFESKFSPRGSVYVRHYFIDRKGFAGPLEISLADRQNRHLQGVTGPKITVPAGVDEFDFPLLLAPWMELGRTSRTCLMAVGDVPLEDGTTARVAFSSQEQNDQIIVLTAPNRMELLLAKNSLIAEAGQAVELAVQIERDGHLSEPTIVELVCPPHMPIATAEKVTIPAGESAGTIKLVFAAGPLPAINMPVMLRATTKDERGFPVVTEALLELAAPEEVTVGMRIIQLSDLHLMTDPAGEIRGVRTRETFEQTLRTVEANYADTDRLIITGDLTHDEKLETYEWLRARLAKWIGRLRVIPGNHDDRHLMREVFGDRLSSSVGGRNTFSDELGEWRLIGLDTHVPGKLHGELGSAQVGWLTGELNSHPNRPACLFLHHPPAEVHSAWLDRIGLMDADGFRETIRRFPEVRAILCGHIHQERTIAFGQSVVLSTPSTGVQFRPETESLEVDVVAPGFRVIDLGSDGEMQTRVERVAG